MDKDLLLRKWLSNELTEAEEKDFRLEEDFEFNEALLDTAKYFKASNLYKVDDFEIFKNRYESRHSTVKKLNWIRPLLRIASVLVVAFGLYFLFFFNNLLFLRFWLKGNCFTLVCPKRINSYRVLIDFDDQIHINWCRAS